MGFINIFSKKLAIELLESLYINEYAINLQKSKQLP